MKKLIFSIILNFLFLTDNTSAKFYVDNNRECPALHEIGQWSYEKRWGSWERRQAWIQGSWESVTLIGLYTDLKHKSYSIKQDPYDPSVIVYIGPWQKITLTKGSFFNKEKIETEIRMIATQRGERGFGRHYETKDEENAKIPEQKYMPIRTPTDLIDHCDILRAQKWGYNAVLDGHINIFRGYLGKSPLATSGKIIDAYTKEVIADENGNLIHTKNNKTHNKLL